MQTCMYTLLWPDDHSIHALIHILCMSGLISAQIPIVLHIPVVYVREHKGFQAPFGVVFFGMH